MGDNFTPLWSESLRHIVFNVAISSDGNTIVASAGMSFSVFDGTGRLHWTKETPSDCLSVSVSHDGELIVASSLFGGVCLYDRSGRQLQQLSDKRARSVSMAPDGSCVAAAFTIENTVSLLSTSGKRVQWNCASKEPAAVATNIDGSCVAVGGASGGLWLHGAQGEVKRHIAAEGCFYGLALDATGSYLAAAPHNRTELCFFSSDGLLQWSKQLDDSSLRVAISDGGDVVACADVHHLRLFARDGSELMSSTVSERLYGVALTPDGSHVVVGGETGIKYLQTSLSFDPVSNWGASVISPRTIPEIRSRYLEFPRAGLCHWFNEFDKYLKSERYAACDALLEEIDSGGYEPDASEVDYITSRRGALALSRGIMHELKQQFADADRYYRIALEFHVACGNREGEGQVRALLDEAEDEGQREALAQQFKAQLKVLGSGAACLTDRVAQAAPDELLKLIYSAKEAGHTEPLLAALNGDRKDHCSGAANAAAALTYLRPGAGIDEVLALFRHQNWFVRWRACDLVNRFVSEHGPTPDIHNAVTLALQRETDSDVRCELLILMSDGIGNAIADDLLSLLNDPDPNVRFASSLMLGGFGSRQVIPALRNVQEGQTYSGDSINDAVASAIEAINQREPELEFERLFLYTPHTNGAERTEFFLIRELTIQGAIRVRNSRPGGKLRLRQDVVDNSVFLLSFYTEIGGELAVNSDEEILELDSEDEANNRFNFQLKRPASGWMPGSNGLYIYFDGQHIDYDSFEIIDSITIQHCVLSTSLNSAGMVIDPGAIFAKNVAHIYCQIVVDKATRGLPFDASVFDIHGNLQRKSRYSTETEGRQRILFHWRADSLKPGTYTVHIDAGSLGEHYSKFEIIEGVKIRSVLLFRDVDWSGTAITPVSSYQPTDDIVCAADMIAGADAIISAELRGQKQRIFDTTVDCITKSSGEQVGTFVFRRPTTEWPTGDYDLTLSADEVPIYTVAFQVKPLPLSQQLSSLVVTAGELVRDDGRVVARSALVWGVKLPMLTLVLFLMDALLTKMAGKHLITSTWLLAFANTIGASSSLCFLIAGIVFGIFLELGRIFLPEKVIRIPIFGLMFVFQALIGQQVAYLAFSPGYLWPNAMGQLFSKILYASPIVAWLAVLFGSRFLNPTYASRESSSAFITETGITFGGIIGLYLSGLFSSLIMGAIWGMILWPFGWFSTGWSIGIYAGFMVGLLSVLASTLSGSNQSN